jgi:hypothetical protein
VTGKRQQYRRVRDRKSISAGADAGIAQIFSKSVGADANQQIVAIVDFNDDAFLRIQWIPGPAGNYLMRYDIDIAWRGRRRRREKMFSLRLWTSSFAL